MPSSWLDGVWDSLMMYNKSIPLSDDSPVQKQTYPAPESKHNVIRWIVDSNFKKEQERLKIPTGALFLLRLWEETKYTKKVNLLSKIDAVACLALEIDHWSYSYNIYIY
jgi:hypothetical protein